MEQSLKLEYSQTLEDLKSAADVREEYEKKQLINEILQLNSIDKTIINKIFEESSDSDKDKFPDEDECKKYNKNIDNECFRNNCLRLLENKEEEKKISLVEVAAREAAKKKCQ